MATCDVCGKNESMPYQCHHCGGTYCSDHRLPEAHDCPGLDSWGDPDGVFDSGFDDSVGQEESGGLTDRLSLGTGRGGFFGYFRGNMTYVFLGLMWVTFLLQHLALIVGGVGLHQTLFVLRPQEPLYVWTWVTSIFAHAPFSLMHIAGNSIIIFFFGRIVENYLGSKRYAAFFLLTGMIAGLSQMGLAYVQVWLAVAQQLGPGGLGASGAGLAIMGFVTVVKPDLRVYLWFLIPVPVWLITIFYLGTSLAGITGYQSIAGGNIAHMAHLAGLVVGMAWALKVKGQRRLPDQVEFGGQRRRGPGGGGGRGPF